GIRESLDDDSPYVRWHLVYVLGKIGFHFTDKAAVFIDDLISLLDDSNRIVRIIAVNAFRQIESGQPGIIEHFFKNIEKEIPPSLVGVLRNSKNCRRRINKSRPLMPGKQ
ncbi:MAG TPA: HEAT repeat domain-containing protein, partial [Acidobacteriota bacterium]|nr:HEAT repeat domain-containing protein [Acidobacteriota bacterium]